MLKNAIRYNLMKQNNIYCEDIIHSVNDEYLWEIKNFISASRKVFSYIDSLICFYILDVMDHANGFYFSLCIAYGKA